MDRHHLRAQLRPQVVEGAEMVAGHNSRCRLAALDAEHTELCTRAAVLEEQASAARADAERAEREREALHAQAARLAEVGAASTHVAVANSTAPSHPTWR